jgi:hypothetical protein
MFHWSIFTSSDPTHFVVSVPLHYMAFLVSLPAVLGVLVFGLKAGHPVRNCSVLAVLLLACGFLGYSSELTIDRASGKATLREFEFFHWSTRTYDLNQIRRMYVATGATTSQLRLQFSDGKVRSLSFMDQYGGKDEVAYKANTFMGLPDHEQDQ